LLAYGSPMHLWFTDRTDFPGSVREKLTMAG
jgi:hypothetical protein